MNRQNRSPNNFGLVFFEYQPFRGSKELRARELSEEACLFDVSTKFWRDKTLQVEFSPHDNSVVELFIWAQRKL